jgi:hypothetical protein
MRRNREKGLDDMAPDVFDKLNRREDLDGLRGVAITLTVIG